MSPPDGTQDLPSQVDTTVAMKEIQNDHLLVPMVDDYVPTGSRDILDSPHVTEGPGKIANAPVPSVFVRPFFNIETD
jgi:hypothetical protein